MSKFGYINIAILICLLSSSVHSKGLRYGGSVGMLSIDSVEYANGSSGEEDILRYGFVHTRPIDQNNNRWRWLFGLNYLDDAVEAPANGIYEELTNYEFRVVPQFALTEWSVFTPYVGAGFSAGYTQYSNRWQVDDEGYKYGLQLDDISQFEVGLVATAGRRDKNRK